MSSASRKTVSTRLRGVHAPSRRSRYSARRLRRVNERRPCNPVSPVHRAPAIRAGRSRVNATDITKPMVKGTKPRSFPTRRKRRAEYAFGGKPDESGSVLRRLSTNPLSLDAIRGGRCPGQQLTDSFGALVSKRSKGYTNRGGSLAHFVTGFERFCHDQIVGTRFRRSRQTLVG